MKYAILLIMALVISGCASKVAIKKDTCECSGNVCICTEAE